MEPSNSYVNTYTKTLDEYFSRADAGFKKWLPKEPVGKEEIIYKPETCEDTVEEDEYYE